MQGNAAQILLAGQDITGYVQQESVQFDSVLGSGPGTVGDTATRASTSQFDCRLGPVGSAYGAGQTLPSSSAGVNPFSADVLALLPVAYYKLAESTGAALDSSGNGNNGTYSASGVTYRAAGQLAGDNDTSVIFDGSAGGVTLPAAVSATGANPWSMLAVINPSSGMATGTHAAAFMGTWNVTSEGTYLGMSSGLAFASVSGNSLQAATALALNTPHLLVSTYDGTTVRLYVDGTLVASLVITLALVAGGASIGYISTDSTHHFGGNEEKTAFFHSCLSAANVAQLWSDMTTTPPAPTPVLVRQGMLQIFDKNGTAVFGGYVTKMDDITNKTQVKSTLYGVDFWQALDRIMVNVVYNGVSDVAIISALMSTYAPSVDLSQVNLSTPSYVFPKLFLRAKTLQEALKKVAGVTGFDIWVDPTNALHYVAPTAEGTAPFAISDTPDYITSFPAKFTKFEVDDNAIINRVTFYGGKTPSANDFNQDISPQANGTNTTFVLAYYPHESSNGKVQVLVGGVQQVVGYVFSSGAANTFKSQGGLCDVLLNRDAQSLEFDVAPASGVGVHCIYRFYTPLMVQLQSSQSVAFFGAYFDGSISDNTIFDVSTAILRARTLLVEQEFGLTTIEFTLTNWPGLVAGTQIRIDNTVRGIHDTYIIQEVKAQGTGGGTYTYDVTCGAWNWQLADVILASMRSQSLEDLSQESETDIIQVETANFTVHTAFVTSTATRTSGQYYARLGALGDGHDMYAGLATITS